MCQGCRGSLRTADGSVPVDIAIAECRSFTDSSGNLITPTRESVSHYHCRPNCVLAVEPHFVCSSLCTPADVLQNLSPIHVQHRQSSFHILK